MWTQNLLPASTIGSRTPSALALIPRLEFSRAEVAVPLIWANNYQNFQVGAMVRLGPLFVGSDNLGGIFGLTTATGADFYFGWALHRRKDRDGDQVSDKYDKCPKQKGPWELKGCPAPAPPAADAPPLPSAPADAPASPGPDPGSASPRGAGPARHPGPGSAAPLTRAYRRYANAGRGPTFATCHFCPSRAFPPPQRSHSPRLPPLPRRPTLPAQQRARLHLRRVPSVRARR